MSMKQKIFEALIVDGKQKTAAQFAAQLGTTPAAVAARVSELRSDGWSISSSKSVDTKGRVKFFYKHSTPARAKR